jgi:PadR family transcriptional regulator PadR
MSESLELIKGTLDVLILKTLSWGPMHGYAVSRWIRETSGEALQVEEGALYPALRRLERQGWLAAEWGESDSGRDARFYRLTPAGRETLERKEGLWRRYAAAMTRVLESARPAGGG